MALLGSDLVVFFGAFGDLAYRKVFPALHALVRNRELEVPILCVERPGRTLEALRERARASVQEHGEADPGTFARFSAQLRYIAGDYTEPATYQRLKEALDGARRPLCYLAIPPSLFPVVVRGLAAAGCGPETRVVVEKPFGRDRASAHALNQTLHQAFPESAIFRIDHYLGKEAVQNLSYFRFANSFLAPLWNRDYIDNVQITLAERFGVEGRGRFYEEVGALRDVVQNHLLQIITLLAMDAPREQGAAALRAEKLRLLQAIRPLAPEDVVRGQFRGYRDEPGVANDSVVETFAALRLHIDNPRWAGVPFYIRTGKCLPITRCEIMVYLKEPPWAVFDEPIQPQSNYFRFCLSPDVTLSLGARVKQPGEAMRGEAVELIARHQLQDAESPYQRLLGDALRGDRTLFTSDECVEAAWAVVEPVLGQTSVPLPYEPGSWGPAAAALVVEAGDGWHDPRAQDIPPC